MKYFVLATLVAIGISGSASASECRPTISITGNSGANSSYDGYGGRGRGSNYSIGITLNIPLFTKYCKQQEREEAWKSKADRRSTEIDNLERLLQLCEEYGYDHPMLAGKCTKP